MVYGVLLASSRIESWMQDRRIAYANETQPCLGNPPNTFFFKAYSISSTYQLVEI